MSSQEHKSWRISESFLKYNQMCMCVRTHMRTRVCVCVHYHQVIRIFDKVCKLGHSFGDGVHVSPKGRDSDRTKHETQNLRRGGGRWTKGRWGNGPDERGACSEENSFLNLCFWQPHPSIRVPSFLFVLLFLALPKAETWRPWEEEKEPASVSWFFSASAFLTQEDARSFSHPYCFQGACDIL